MDITYLGGASFLLKGEQVVAVNPTGRSAGAGITLHSSRRQNARSIVDGPGEYEIGGTLIATLEKGQNGASTLVHAGELGGLNVVHAAGGLAELSEDDLQALGKVDVLLVSAEDLKAAQLAVTELTPRVTLPFGPGAPELCAVLGVRAPEPQPRFSWNGAGSVPKAVLLKAVTPRKRAA